jgi:hypothetical protein
VTTSVPSPRRSLLLAPLALVLALAVLAVAGAAPAAAKLRSLETGVSYVYGNEPAEFAHVAATGAKFVLVPMNWSDVAPEKEPASWDPENPGDPNYDWSFFDTWVRNALGAGLTPVLQVRGAPEWAQACGPFPHDSPCEPEAAKLASFAKAAALRYSGHYGGLPRVRYWQGLNEPNYQFYFEPQYRNGKPVSAGLYRPLINAFYGAVKSVLPSDVVIAAGLGPLGLKGETVGPLKFARELLCMKGRANPKPTGGSCEGGVHFDVFDIHPYTSGGPTHEGGFDNLELGDLPRLQTLLAAADKAGRIKSNLHHRTPLWIIEMAWDSKPPDPGGLPQKIGQQWMAEALYRTWEIGVEHFFWFTVADFPREGRPPSQVNESGFYEWAPQVTAQKPKTRLIAAYRFPFVALRQGNGLMVWGRTFREKAGTVKIETQTGSGWKTLKTLRADSNGMFTATLKTTYGANKKGAVRARFGGSASVPFPMNPVGDFFQPPFG